MDNEALRTYVESLKEKFIDETKHIKKDIKDLERKVESLYTKMNEELTKFAVTTEFIKNINEKINALSEDIKHYKSTKEKRVNVMVDEIIRWGTIIVLGFIAYQLGIK